MDVTQIDVMTVVIQSLRDFRAREWIGDPGTYAMNLKTRNLLVRQQLNPDKILPPDPNDHVLGAPITIDDELPDWTVEAR